MSLSKITYANKTALSPQPGISAENKVSDSDMNEIKSVVNDAIDFVEPVKGTALYNDASGTTGTVNLSESVANFDYIEIFFKNAQYTPIFSSVRVYKPSDTNVCLVAMQPGNGGTGIVAAYVKVSGTTITKVDYNIFWTNGGGNDHTDKIYITRVMGYK